MEDSGQFIGSLFRRQAPFNILALLASTIGPIVCTSLAGIYFGSDGLAIVTICAPLFLAAAFLGFIISGGAQIVCSGYIAKDDLDNVNNVYSAVIVLNLAISTIVCATLLLFKQPLLTLLAGEISQSLSVYYTFFVLNSFLFIPAYLPLFFSKLIGKPQIGFVLTGVMSFISIVASLILVNYMGVEAVALGQAIGTAVGLLISMLMIRKFFKFKVPKVFFIKPILTAGSPLGLTRLYILVTTLILNALFLRLGGSVALAVWGVVAMLHRFITAFTLGVAQTLVPLVAVFHEERDTTSIKQTMKTAFDYGNTVIILVGFLLIVFRNQISLIFGLSESGEELVLAIPIYVVYAILLMNTTIFSSYYNAVKRIKLANVIPFFQEFAVIVIGSIALMNLLGTTGIWISFLVSGIITLFILLVILLFIKCKDKDLSIPLLLNQRLERDGKYISFSVENNPEKASEAAEKVSDFCEEYGVNPKQTMQISMSIEEIITLIINSSKKKNFTVSVRLFILDEMIILRIRNTGEKFNAIQYYEKNIAEANITDDNAIGATEKSLDIIGMKYIVQSAKVIYYRETFGVNSLVVIL